MPELQGEMHLRVLRPAGSRHAVPGVYGAVQGCDRGRRMVVGSGRGCERYQVYLRLKDSGAFTSYTSLQVSSTYLAILQITQKG